MLVGARAWLGALAHALRSHDAVGADDRIVAKPPRWPMWLGLALLLVASASLEWTRLYQWEAQVAGGNAGGVLGAVLGRASQSLLGFAGSGVLWIAVLVAAASMALRFSWLRVADALGAAIESLRNRRVERIERAEDARLGAAAVRERDEVLEVAHELSEQHLPLVIEPTLVDVPKSTRVVKERQKPLFSELVDTKLPQVDLLDSAPQRVESVSAESLEMTSRLIEKRLKDFGVEVRVVAASPGPVITRYEIEPALGVKGAQVVEPGQGPGALARPGVDSRRRDDSRARRRWRSSCRTRSGRRSVSPRCSARRPTPIPARSSRSASARTSSACPSSPTCRRCRIAWSPAPPARASRSASTR